MRLVLRLRERNKKYKRKKYGPQGEREEVDRKRGTHHFERYTEGRG